MLKGLGEIQIELRGLELEGWLISDYRGRNPVARRALALGDRERSRRLFYWIPADGLPVLLAHRAEARGLPELPGDVLRYSSWAELRDGLSSTLPNRGLVAMEHCPMGSNPELSHVDAGTLELILSYGPQVVSSADLVQRFLCAFDEAQRESHGRAADALARLKDEVLGWIAVEREAARPVTEGGVRAHLLESLEREGLRAGDPPRVAFGSHTADPCHAPVEEKDRALCDGDLIRLELAGRETGAEGAFAFLAWIAYAGERVPPRLAQEFGHVAHARDEALDLLRRRLESGRRVLGFEVDRVARDALARAGLRERCPHRMGHHLGIESAHGLGASLDDLETHDTRPLLTGMAFAVRPGVYFEDHGLRTGMSVYLADSGPKPTTPLQEEIHPIGAKATD